MWLDDQDRAVICAFLRRFGINVTERGGVQEPHFPPLEIRLSRGVGANALSLVPVHQIHGLLVYPAGYSVSSRAVGFASGVWTVYGGTASELEAYIVAISYRSHVRESMKKNECES